jgi:hypothetical protein
VISSKTEQLSHPRGGLWDRFRRPRCVVSLPFANKCDDLTQASARPSRPLDDARALPSCRYVGQLDAKARNSIISSRSFVCGGSRPPPPPSVPGPWRRSPLGALRAPESGTPTRSGVGSLGSNGPARQDRPQDHPTSATEHERALTTRELALRAVAAVGADRHRPELPTTEAPARVAPQESPPYRAAGDWRVVVTTSRRVPHSAAPQAQRRTVRTVIDREAARRQARRHDARPHGPQSSARRWPLGSQNERPASS